jgi:hypothetical protein
MDQKQFDAMLSDAETRLRRLKMLYEQWFMGFERMEPAVLRKELEDLLMRLRKEQSNNTALRFRLQQLIQRHTTFTTYWRRIGRQIEEGTYQRDVVRAKRNRSRAAQERDNGSPELELSYDVDLDIEIDAALEAANRVAETPAVAVAAAPAVAAPAPPAPPAAACSRCGCWACAARSSSHAAGSGARSWRASAADGCRCADARSGCCACRAPGRAGAGRNPSQQSTFAFPVLGSSCQRGQASTSPAARRCAGACARAAASRWASGHASPANWCREPAARSCPCSQRPGRGGNRAAERCQTRRRSASHREPCRCDATRCSARGCGTNPRWSTPCAASSSSHARRSVFNRRCATRLHTVCGSA